MPALNFSEVVERRLPCGHRLTFGNCGAAGEPGDITHQKDASLVESYEKLWQMYPTFAPVKVLELGICRGGGLAIWRELFPDAEVHGVDHDLYQVMPWTVAHFREDSRICVHDMHLPSARVAELGEFDLIVDDGEHGPGAVFPAFQQCWPMLRPGGLYVVEDWRQEFLKPQELVTYFASRLVGDWREERARPGSPVSMVATRGFLALEKM